MAREREEKGNKERQQMVLLFMLFEIPSFRAPNVVANCAIAGRCCSSAWPGENIMPQSE